jgi:hypothetical protein
MFLVMAYRYGTNEYSFPVGIFSDMSTAIEMAKLHREYRGGKYDHRMYRLAVDEMYDAEETKYVWVTGPKATVWGLTN